VLHFIINTSIFSLHHHYPLLGLKVGKKKCWYSPFCPLSPPLPLPFPSPYSACPPLPLEVGPLNPARGMQSPVSCPSGVQGKAPAANTFLAYFGA